MVTQLKPEFLLGHPLGVEEPEEEGFLTEADFQSLCSCFQVRVPTYFNEIVDSSSSRGRPPWSPSHRREGQP